MKISNVRLEEDGNSVTLAADCSMRHFGADKIYFKFDRKCKDAIVCDASPFAAALLIPAMKLGHDLIIEGKISRKLYEGMHMIMKKMLSWNIGLKEIKIVAKELQSDEYSGKESASFFSGGVDSFYTYLKNNSGKEKKISNFILAFGYDITLSNKKLWNETKAVVENIAEAEDINVIEVESNIRTFTEPVIEWSYAYGGCLAALGLSLRKELNNIFIPSTYSFEQLIPDGSHPVLDYLWGTESVSFAHDGAEATRLEKVQFISAYPVVLRNLRVCFLNKKDVFNCGVCDKCMRTMISLKIAGVLEKAATFPHAIDLAALRKIKIDGEYGAIFQRENLAELKRRNIEPEIQDALEEVLQDVHKPASFIMSVAIRLWFLDFYYNRSRLYLFADYFRKKQFS